MKWAQTNTRVRKLVVQLSQAVELTASRLDVTLGLPGRVAISLGASCLLAR